MADGPQTTMHPANDDDNAIPFSELCAALGEDEDVVLQRLAVILRRRESDD